jgi:hypothetical protein
VIANYGSAALRMEANNRDDQSLKQWVLPPPISEAAYEPEPEPVGLVKGAISEQTWRLLTKETETMAIDVRDQRQEIVAFYDQVVRDLDRRLARIERTRNGTYRSVPAWQHLTQRRAYFQRLRAAA